MATGRATCAAVKDDSVTLPASQLMLMWLHCDRQDPAVSRWMDLRSDARSTTLIFDPVLQPQLLCSHIFIVEASCLGPVSINQRRELHPAHLL